jgi:hypothetical protein
VSNVIIDGSAIGGVPNNLSAAFLRSEIQRTLISRNENQSNAGCYNMANSVSEADLSALLRAKYDSEIRYLPKADSKSLVVATQNA